MTSHVITRSSPRRHQAGFTMIEILITFLILIIGLLGLIGLQARSQQAELESYQRGQALVLLQDIVDRMNANRLDAKNQLYQTAAAVGTGSSSPTPLTDCSAMTGAAYDLCEWSNLLIGAAETNSGGSCNTTSGAGCAGAMRDARGCITYDTASELKDSAGATIVGTGVQTIRVFWKGIAPTGSVGAVACGTDNFAADSTMRMASTTVQLAGLTAK